MLRVSCQVCQSTLKAGDLYCSSCGAVVPARPSKPQIAEVRGRIAGERKYLTVLCADLQRSTDLISELDPEAAISRLEPALIAMRTAVRRNRGIVSKEGGDGLIALFGAPHADDNHALMACYAAIELVNRIKLLDDPRFRSVLAFIPAMSSLTSSRPISHRSMKRAARRSIWSSGSRAPRRPGRSWCRSPARTCPQG
jgi:class 3 adenylate cyclase